MMTAMSKDFANRKSSSANRRAPSREATSRGAAPRSAPSRSSRLSSPLSSPQKGKPGQSRKKTQSTLFHGPSFSGGVVLGAILVLAGAYLPEVFRETAQETLAVKSLESRESVQFEFDERLRKSEVLADPDSYADDANPGTNATMEYLIQAASFRTMEDAQSLRAQLIRMDLPVSAKAVEVGEQPWYRVTVGPFLSQVEAGRAMTRLRELNLDAFLIKRER